MKKSTIEVFLVCGFEKNRLNLKGSEKLQKFCEIFFDYLNEWQEKFGCLFGRNFLNYFLNEMTNGGCDSVNSKDDLINNIGINQVKRNGKCDPKILLEFYLNQRPEKCGALLLLSTDWIGTNSLL